MTAGRLILVAAALAAAGLLGARCGGPDRAMAVYAQAQSPPALQLTDQHFSGCNEARAAGRINIPIGDPSYRDWMDGDGDGLACEAYHGPRTPRTIFHRFPRS